MLNDPTKTVHVPLSQHTVKELQATSLGASAHRADGEYRYGHASTCGIGGALSRSGGIS